MCSAQVSFLRGASRFMLAHNAILNTKIIKTLYIVDRRVCFFLFSKLCTATGLIIIIMSAFLCYMKRENYVQIY